MALGQVGRFKGAYDEAMGNTTGQAGVTIELETNLSIDSIEYSQGDTGSFLVNDLVVGGTNLADFDADGDGNPDAGTGTDGALNLDLTVDLAGSNDFSSTYNDKLDGTGGANGGLELFGATNRSLADGDAIISVGSLDGKPVDLGVTIGESTGTAMQLTGDDTGTATLVSEVSMDVYLSQLDIIARAEADGLSTDGTLNNTGTTGSGALQVDALFSVADLDAKIDVAAVGIRNMKIAGNTQADGTTNTLDTLSSDNNVEAQFLDPAQVAPAVVSMNIGAGQSLSGSVSDSLRISLDTFQADMYIGAIGIGNEGLNAAGEFASIGSLGIDNLKITDTEVAIYGRN